MFDRNPAGHILNNLPLAHFEVSWNMNLYTIWKNEKKKKEEEGEKKRDISITLSSKFF